MLKVGMIVGSAPPTRFADTAAQCAAPTNWITTQEGFHEQFH